MWRLGNSVASTKQNARKIYTRLIRKGALIEETYSAFQAWDLDKDFTDNLAILRESNIACHLVLWICMRFSFSLMYPMCTLWHLWKTKGLQLVAVTHCFCGGEVGIRTLGTLPYTWFRVKLMHKSRYFTAYHEAAKNRWLIIQLAYYRDSRISLNFIISRNIRGYVKGYGKYSYPFYWGTHNGKG